MSNVVISSVFPTIIYNDFCLEELARLAVGEGNAYNVSTSIPFGLLNHIKGDSVMMVMHPRVISCPDWIMAKKAAWLNEASDYVLGSIGELAQFTAQYPQEVAKYSAVFALDGDSRWDAPDGNTYVGYTSAEGSKRCFRSYRLEHLLSSEDGIIVFEKNKVDHRVLSSPCV